MDAKAPKLTKWTPGPWSAFYKSKYDEWHVSLPSTGSGMRIALCPDGIQSGNRQADAHLIAAAPDMAEALQQIAEIDRTAFSVGEVSRGMDRVGEIARRALSLAKGEQP